MKQSWFGRTAQLIHFLRVVGADKDDAGQFIVGGQIAAFLGLPDEDVVVGEDAYYLKGGQRMGLASGLRGTSYGMAVTAIFAGKTEVGEP
jgi:hypothetical protein